MKSVTLLMLAKEENSALEALRDLGVMQLLPTESRSAATQSSLDVFAQVQRTVQFLENIQPEDAEQSESGDAARGRAIIAEVDRLIGQKNDVETRAAAVDQRLDRLEAWGDFDRSTLEELKSRGVHVLLCSGTPEKFADAGKIDDLALSVIRKQQHRVDFAAIYNGDAVPEEIVKMLPVVNLSSEDDPRQLRKEKEMLSAQLEKIENDLIALSGELPAVKRYLNEAEENVEFDRAADAMREHGEISVLQGFVPEPDVDALRSAAAVNGWGLFIRDPREDENVPVLLKNNRFTRIIKPLFDFLGIAPGYHEIDVSGGVLIFFTLFYAIIIGDAGYGIVFAGAALLGLRAAKRKPALKLPMTLFLVLSIAATVWGALCGSWFGLSVIPGTDIAIPGVECFRDFASSNAKQANIQFFCFILAVLQLSLGRIWRVLRERNWRSLGQHLGWILIIWGNFFLTVRLIVYPGEFPQYMYILYGVGLVMVVLFGLNWKNAADVFQFPFDIIGSFTDVLSYIRLFAVGLAGACIAGSFNGMAFDVSAVSAWLIPAGVLVALGGHALNIALAFLSVLVHAVRLNTLEFSNHAGLSWSGQSFNPFRKLHKDKE